jgi:F-type H+-transporting ATPase subunit b
MHVDWTTVGLQVVNFLFALWILNRWLFRPVMANMARRDEAVKKRLSAAERALRDAEDEKKRLGREYDSLHSKRERMLAEQKKAAEEEQARLLKGFDAEISRRRDAFEEELLAEREALKRAAAVRAGRAIVSVAAEALKDLADVDLQSAIVRRFARLAEKGELDGVAELRAAIRRHGNLDVTTPFKLSNADRRALAGAIAHISSVRPKWRVDGALSGSIAISSGSTELVFGLDGYISGIGEKLDWELDKC